MPISCIPVSLYPDFRSGKLTNAEWIKLGAQAGLDGVDFSPSFLPEDPKALEEMRRQLEDAGLQGVMIVGHQDFTHPQSRQAPTRNRTGHQVGQDGQNPWLPLYPYNGWTGPSPIEPAAGHRPRGGRNE